MKTLLLCPEKSSKKIPQKGLTVPKIVAQCRNYVFPYLITLRDPSIPLYITKITTLLHCRPILRH